MQKWKVLAQEGEGVVISACPAGHIHLDYGQVTLRFSKEEFRTFAAMVGRAVANLDGAPLLKRLPIPVEDGVKFSKN